MKLPERGEKGFTLIELLIVVAILGVLAAVVIPNVGRFIGRGETEAAQTELDNIQTAVISMMVDNNLQDLDTPVQTSTNNMQLFPDITTVADKTGETDPDGDLYTNLDKYGFILFQHDLLGGDTSNSTGLVNYVASNTTANYYTVDSAGTVHQHDSAGQAH